MTKLEIAARQALEALELSFDHLFMSGFGRSIEKAITALREALAEQSEQEQPTSDGICQEPDGCPTELAVLQRFWRITKAEQAEQEPVAWQGAEEWEPLAFQLCADENGEESCNELLWDGGVIPEPWGERWLKYEDEAKRMIEYVRKYAAPVRTKDLADDEITKAWESMGRGFGKYTEFARAVIAAYKEKQRGI